MGDAGELTEPVLRPRPEPAQLTQDARRGARRFDEHTVMGLTLAGVLAVTVAVWLLMPVQMAWLQWAVEHGQPHPFVLGNVVETTRYADYTG